MNTFKNLRQLGLILSVLFSFCRFSSAQHIQLVYSPLVNYGPYYYPNTDSNSMQLTVNNLTLTQITGTVSFEIYKDQVLFARLNTLYRPTVIVPAAGSVSSPSMTVSSDLHEIDFFNSTFEDNLKAGTVQFDSTYSFKGIFNYTYTELEFTEDTMISFTNPVQVPKIDIITPLNNDTFSITASAVNIRWGGVIFKNWRKPKYRLKIYPVYSSQSDSLALLINTPVLDTLVDSVDSYIWERGSENKEIIFDSTYVPFERYIITVASILESTETNALWNNKKQIQFNFSNIPYPWLNHMYDSFPHLHSGARWGFDEELYGDSTFPPTGYYKMNAPNQSNATCSTGNADQNNFNGWTGWTGTHYPNNVVLNIPGINYVQAEEENSQHFIMNKYDGNNNIKLDPTTQKFPVVSPLGGDYSFRIGDLKAGSKASTLAYTFTVTETNSTLKILYALVLIDPIGHEKAEKPFFQVHIYDETTNQIPFLYRYYVNKSDPFFKNYNQYSYKEWTCAPANLTPLIGHTIKIVFTVTDCTEGGHLGYGYVDLLCDEQAVTADLSISDTEICLQDETIIANATGSQNELNHYWKIEECTSNGTPIANTAKTKYFYSMPAGQMAIKPLYRLLGGKWKCDQYYNITVGVKGPCSDTWDTETIKIYINPCLEADAGPDQAICAGSNQVAIIGQTYSPPPNNVTFSWSPTSYLTSPTSSSTNANPPTTTEYILTATNNSNECVSVDTVIVFVQDGKSFSIENDGGMCTRWIWIEPDFDGPYTVVWSGPNGFSSTSKKIGIAYASESPGTYTAVITNSCGTHSEDIEVTTVFLGVRYTDKLNFMGWEPTIAEYTFQIPEVVYPFSSNPANTHFRVFDVRHGTDLSASTKPAYYSTGFRLNIIAGYGDMIYRYSPTVPLLGYSNGDIMWPCKYASGQYVPVGLYQGELYLKNCVQQGWWRYGYEESFFYNFGFGIGYTTTRQVYGFPIYVVY